VERNPGRTEALRCTLELREEGWWVRTTGSQGSHVLSSMLTAEAFALIPPGDGWVEPGSPVAIELV
jgi:molybdopterin molybdotransferase